jgi:hypothetical protein
MVQIFKIKCSENPKTKCTKLQTQRNVSSGNHKLEKVKENQKINSRSFLKSKKVDQILFFKLYFILYFEI